MARLELVVLIMVRKLLRNRSNKMEKEEEQKKEYVKPEMTVYEYAHQANLLQGSCNHDGCMEAEFNG